MLNVIVTDPPRADLAAVDALAPHGVTHVDMPLLPEKLWSALNS